VCISARPLGALANVGRSAGDALHWTFGVQALMRNLAGRGILPVGGGGALEAGDGGGDVNVTRHVVVPEQAFSDVLQQAQPPRSPAPTSSESLLPPTRALAGGQQVLKDSGSSRRGGQLPTTWDAGSIASRLPDPGNKRERSS